MTFSEALKFIGGLGKPSKMPCHSYSISAKNCQTGGKLHEVEGSVCNKCYALRGNYLFAVVQNAHQFRLDAFAKPEWVEAATIAIGHYEQSGYFRWFDAGDLQSVAMLEKIVQVCRNLPHIKFWLPTKELKYISQYVKAGGTFPDNLTVRLSGYMVEEKPSKTILDRLNIQGSSVSKVEWTCQAPNKAISARHAARVGRKTNWLPINITNMEIAAIVILVIIFVIVFR